MAMDAGNFSNFNKVGNRGIPPQPKQPTTAGPKESPSVQQDPTESVQLGAQPVADAKTDKVSSGQSEPKLDFTAQFSLSSTSSIPSQVGDFLIAGPSAVGGVSGPRSVTFDGLTALNGISSTSLQSIGGSTVSSVNPLNPKAAIKPPTTSADLVVSPFEDAVWYTTSGREIQL